MKKAQVMQSATQSAGEYKSLYDCFCGVDSLETRLVWDKEETPSQKLSGSAPRPRSQCLELIM